MKQTADNFKELVHNLKRCALPICKTATALIIIASNTLTASAQEADSIVTIKDVEVKAARIVNKIDGMLIYPSEAQKEASNTGYSILRRLGLPNIRIDDVNYSISAIDSRGSVQARINGIIAGRPEMLSLNPKYIIRIEFIDNPGVRYGDGIAYVINIITERKENGYTAGTDLTQTVTTKKGDYDIYGKLHNGKSELSLNYGFGFKDFRGSRTEETADYHLNDGSIKRITRNDFDSRSMNSSNYIKLTYNMADSTDRVFQVSLNGNFNNTPGNFNKKNITEEQETYTATGKYKSKSWSPVLDMYYFNQFTPKQSITINAVGTYIKTDNFNSYDEGGSYEYNVDGKTYSIMGEAIYENKFKPFTLSAGLNYKYKNTDNCYIGDVSSDNIMRNNHIYAFSEIKGYWKNLRYSAGAGASYMNYRQGNNKYNYWTFNPKVALAYNFTKGLQLSYNFKSNERISRIAMMSDATIRNNSMEWTVGSPDLKPSRDIYNILRLSYSDSRITSYAECLYKMCPNTNMAVYERTENDKFIYTQRNQKEIDALNAMAYVNYWVIPEKLSIMAYGGLFRCFNFGYDYTHCYTSYFVAGSIDAYLGNFSISAYADNGSRFLEGETKGYNGGYSVLNASYKYKNWQFSISWQQPLVKRYKMLQSEILNKNLKKNIALYSTDYSNMVSLKITWRIEKGRKYRSADKRINLSDNDTGIMK